MLDEDPATPSRSSAPRTSPGQSVPMRVAVICDLVEERWPSMDLIGDMLYLHLANGYGGEMTVTQVRPLLRRRLTRIPLAEGKLAWNVDRLANRFADYPFALRS